ncbi:MAG: hypothetical protein VX246_01270 [Myxococcota bacterium]|nr:hypothetical protein [Myxococcota bacterium]
MRRATFGCASPLGACQVVSGPEAVLDGLIKPQARVQTEVMPADGRHRELDELVLGVVEKPVP